MIDLKSESAQLTKHDYSVSVVIPVYNEEQSLLPLYEQLTSVLGSSVTDYEILFIDDGSTDGSVNTLKRLWQSDSHVRLIQHRRNFGKADALAAGFAEARYEIVITLDADLQDDPVEIPRMIAKLDEGFDVISG